MSEKNLKSIDSKDSEKVSGGCIGDELVYTGSRRYGTYKRRYRVYNDDDYCDNTPVAEGIETLEEAKKEAERRGLSTKWKRDQFPLAYKAEQQVMADMQMEEVKKLKKKNLDSTF